MKLYFGNTITITITILIVGIICYMIVLWKKREKINYWGRHIFILFAWGLYICIEAATRDNFHLTVQNAIDGITNPGLLPLISFPTIVGMMGAAVVIISGIICLFIRNQSTKRKFCYIVMAAIIIKIVIIEVSRIFLI